MANNVASNVKNSINNRSQQLMEFMDNSSVEENMMMLNYMKGSLLSSDSETNQEFQRFCIFFILKLLEHYNRTKTIAEKKLIKSIVETFKILFDHTVIDDERVFLSTYYFLKNEIYDSNISNVKQIDEEYKLLITQTTTALMNSLTDQVILQLYTRDSILSLSTMVYVMCEMVRYEKFTTLRMATIECLLSISKIKCLETGNIILMKKIADALRFVLPGTLSALGSVITEGETCNHKIIVLALQAFGKLLTLHFQDYDNSIQSSVMQDLPLESKSSLIPKNKWKNFEEAREFLQNNHCTVTWFKQTDLQLHKIVTNFVKLTCHSHDAVKEELIKSFFNVVDVCSITIPKTISKLFEISIILQEDESPEIQFLSQMMLQKFSLNSSQRILADNLEENFFDCVSSLSRVFNAFDEQQQISSLNLLIGYMKLFGTNHLSNVLQSHTHLHHLIQSLLHIAQLEQKNIHLIEEYMIQDLDVVGNQRTPWKNFYYFREESVKLKLEMVFETFVYCNVQDKISDLLTEIFLKSVENRKETTTILNSLMLGIARYSNADDNMELLTSVLKIYMDPEYWDLQLQVQQGILMHQVQTNLIQICLQIEGIGIIASVMKEKFKQFLFKCMFSVLIRAGSGHPLIKMAGISAITSIAIACGNIGVTDLLIDNSDYFSFHVIRRMRNSDPDESVLNVLAVMIKYSNLDIVPSIAHIIREVILPPRGQFRDHNINAYLRVIQIFIKSLQKCLNIEPRIEPIKSKLQRKLDYEEFQLSNLNINDYEVQGKTAQEMYEEDMEQAQHEMEGGYDDMIDPYPKIELPLPHQLTADLVELCLHFLSSKDPERQLLVIDIINQGLEIVRDFEDTLLPLVHKVWSPLSNRFSDDTDVLIINYSFQLFVTLARLSKDFIRSRSMNYVIPKLTRFLKEYSKSSYLQDRGAHYRCTKAYKLQLLILQQFGRALTNLEVSDSCINSVMESVVLYLNKKQPIPLQDAAKSFLRDVAKFDQELVKSMMATQNGEEVKINAMAVLLSL